MDYDLAVQIVNYNTKNYLIKCIRDVIDDLKNSALKYQILVLDNNSNDRLEDLYEIFGNIDLSVFHSEKNLGFGGGHNYLYGKTSALNILILNPDIELIEKETFKRLLSFFNGNSGISVLGPKVVTEGNHPLEHDHGELKGFKAWYKINLGDSYWRERFDSGDVAWVSGAFLLIRSSVFSEVNGFDENFFMYKEEEDLCFRIRKQGGKVYYYPDVKVFHHSEVSSAKSKFIEKSKEYFIEKNLRNKLSYRTLSVLRRFYRKVK